jgi:uncharacterized protein YdeI (YjbR/CyaY-like superfamily)
MAKKTDKQPKRRRAGDDLPSLSFPSQAAWQKWLAKHHQTSHGIWLKFAKKASGVSSVYYPQALEVALCYGWIDGQVRRLDDTHYLQRFTPRTARSKWSRINCGKAEALIEAGRMSAAGLRQVEAAKADGRWGFAYESPRSAVVPPDLLAALRKNRVAREFFETLQGRNRYAILYRIQDAKRPETRARRVAHFVQMLAEQKKPYP